jgi:nitrogen fixation NifU-like protein
MPIYSKKVMDHFLSPHNMGVIKKPDGVGEVGNPVCGDLMKIFIKVKKEKGKEIISEIKFQTLGCGSAIATSSMVTDMALGKSIEEALKITRNDVAKNLDGLPPEKMHCSNLAADALKEAIEDYKNKTTR